jgi:hypothetical protein
MVNFEQAIENAPSRTIVSTSSSSSLFARLQHRDEYCLDSDEQLVENFPFSDHEWKS